MIFYYLSRKLFYILIYLFYFIIIYVETKLKFYCPNDHVLVLNRIVANTIKFECQEAKFCETMKYVGFEKIFYSY